MLHLFSNVLCSGESGQCRHSIFIIEEKSNDHLRLQKICSSIKAALTPSN